MCTIHKIQEFLLGTQTTKLLIFYLYLNMNIYPRIIDQLFKCIFGKLKSKQVIICIDDN